MTPDERTVADVAELAAAGLVTVRVDDDGEQRVWLTPAGRRLTTSPADESEGGGRP